MIQSNDQLPKLELAATLEKNEEYNQGGEYEAYSLRLVLAFVEQDESVLPNAKQNFR